MCHFIKLAEHIFLNSQYNLLAIHLAGFSANLRTKKLRLMSSLYKDTIRYRCKQPILSLAFSNFQLRHVQFYILYSLIYNFLTFFFILLFSGTTEHFGQKQRERTTVERRFEQPTETQRTRAQNYQIQ